MKNIRAGIIGCGGIANNKHLPSIKELGGVDMIAFCDILEGRAIKAAGIYGTPGAKVFTDYQELLKEELDAVYVCMLCVAVPCPPGASSLTSMSRAAAR